MSRVYLDWNATSPLRTEARGAMLCAMDTVGNPSSVHAEGRAAKAIIEKSRGQVAALVGCEPGEVVFTSGATEAAALAVHQSEAFSCSPVEHDCVLRHADHPDETWSVTPSGAVISSSEAAIGRTPGNGKMIAVSLANNETGVLNDVKRFSCDSYSSGPRHRLLSDAVQAVGKTNATFKSSGADYFLVSAHKLGGPNGVGALIVRGALDVEPVLKGGGQEMRRRSGTENVTGIAGFGAAAKAAQRDQEAGVWDQVAALRNRLEERLVAEASDLIIFGSDIPRLPNTSYFAIPGWKGETQVMQMDLAGFAISAGSACSSGKAGASRVLLAMGFDGETAASAIRVSMGPTTTEDQVMDFAGTWIEHYRRRKIRAA